MVIVVLHGVSWEELAAADVPALQALLRQAAVGVMNTRPLGSPDELVPYVSIGAGRAAVANRRVWPPAAMTVASGRPRKIAVSGLRRANQEAHTQAEPGLLGTLLRQRQRGVALFLDTYRGAQAATPSVALAMDAGGALDWVGWMLLGTGPHQLDHAMHHSDLLVVDISRLLALRPQAPAPPAPDPEALGKLRGADSLLRRIGDRLDVGRDLLMIVGPTCPPYAFPRYVGYSPIAIIGPGFGRGLLTSASSRRPGMVSNTDIAPTILRYFGSGQPAAMSGHPMVARPADKPLSAVLAISRRGVRLFDLQWRLAPAYAAGQSVAFMGVGAALLLAPAWALRRRRRLQLALLMGMSLPLALLLLGPLDPGGVVAPYLIVAALAMLLGWLAWVGSPPLTAMGALLSTTAAVMMLDLVTGRHLLDNYILNYGAYATRLYGMHNESMGAAMACAVIGGAALAGSLRPLALWFVVVAAIIGAPRWGADWGGGVTAAFAFAVCYLAIRAGAPKLRHWAAAAAVAAAAGALMVVIDLASWTGPSTHIGDAARLIGAGGGRAMWDMVARKAGGNLHIIALAPYAVAGMVICAVGVWLVFKPPARLRAALEAHRGVWGGIAGAVAGAIVAALVNDSGLVAASTAAGIFASAIAFVALQITKAQQ